MCPVVAPTYHHLSRLGYIALHMYVGHIRFVSWMVLAILRFLHFYSVFLTKVRALS